MSQYNEQIDQISEIIASVPCPAAPASDVAAWQAWCDRCIAAVNAKGIDASSRWNDEVMEIAASVMDAVAA